MSSRCSSDTDDWAQYRGLETSVRVSSEMGVEDSICSMSRSHVVAKGVEPVKDSAEEVVLEFVA